MRTVRHKSRQPAAVRPRRYCLLLHKPEAGRIAVGRLGVIYFPGGYYIYTGSAVRGLKARIERHKRRRKKPHWHIDYLRRSSQIVEVAVYAGPSECGLNAEVSAMKGARVVAAGFGSSDCRCETHLYHFRSRPALPGKKKGD